MTAPTILFIRWPQSPGQSLRPQLAARPDATHGWTFGRNANMLTIPARTLENARAQ